MKNIELKIFINNFKKVEKLLKKNKGRFKMLLRQTDTYYHYHFGRLKIREINGKNFEAIFYQRPNIKKSKISNYYIVKVEKTNLKILKNIFTKFFGQQIVIKKERRLWILKNTRIHLDKVIGFGNFLELETVVKKNSLKEAQKEHQWVIKILQLSKYKKYHGSYSYMQ